MHVPRKRFDPKRNTSAVQPVDPAALPRALASLHALRTTHPALVQWILDGHPHLTPEEHTRRFGGPYVKQAKRRHLRSL